MVGGPVSKMRDCVSPTTDYTRDSPKKCLCKVMTKIIIINDNNNKRNIKICTHIYKNIYIIIINI